jgi:DNA-directed RNA polymerase subunit M/transcription elongation factor TFIIS
VNPRPKPGSPAVIEWTRGELAKLVDKTNTNFSHTLDSKLEYYFVVVDDSNPGDGAQIVRSTKLLGDLLKSEIKQQIDSNGVDGGNPLISPYAFKWVYDVNAIPMKKYAVFRYNQAKLTDNIRDAITSADFPDPEDDTVPKAGDKAKIRAAFEDAAQVDLPWNLLFPNSWIDEDHDSFDYGTNVKEDKIIVQSNVKRTKKETPKSDVEMVSCDDCGALMFITDTRCKKCGAEYDVEIDNNEDNKENIEYVDDKVVVGISTKIVEDNKEVSTKVEENEAVDKCWSCGGEVIDDRCSICGLDVSDSVPF